MRTPFRHAAPALCLLALSCSSATDPASSPADEFTVLAEARVGPAGGLLAADGFELTVPAGAFGAAQDLVLSIDADAAPLGTEGTSALYRIQGLPAQHEAPLRLAVRHGGTREGAGFIADGALRFSSEIADETLEYIYHEATDSLEYLVAHLPARPAPREGASRAELSEEERRILGLQGWEYLEVSPFLIVGSPSAQPAFTELAIALTTLRTYLIAELGLGPLEDRITVAIESGDAGALPPRAVIAGPDAEGEFEVTFKLGATWVEDGLSPELAPRLGRLFIHRHQRMTDLIDGNVPLYARHDHLVIHKAFEYWFEKLFTTDENYVRPASFTDPNALIRAAHLDIDIPSSSGEVLAGAANLGPLIDYLMGHPDYGVTGFRALCLVIGETNPVWDAFFLPMSEPPGAWLPDFYRAYVMGEHYGVEAWEQLELTAAWSPTSGDAIFTATGDELRLYRDLSAKIFGIDLSAVNPEPGTRLRLAAEGEDLAVLAFGAEESGTLQFLGEGDEVLFEDVGTLLIDQGMQGLFALVLNGGHSSNYYGETSIPFTAELSQPQSFQSISFHLEYDALFAEEGIPGEQLYEDQILSMQAEGLVDTTDVTLPISWTFCWGCDSLEVVAGQVSARFAADFRTLYELAATCSTIVYTSSQPEPWTKKEHLRIEGPLELESEGPPWRFVVNGLDVANHLTELTYTSTSVYGTFTLTEFVITPTSSFYIYLQ